MSLLAAVSLDVETLAEAVREAVLKGRPEDAAHYAGALCDAARAYEALRACGETE